MPLTLPAPALAAAYDAVRYAVGTDPAYPVLGCVLVSRDFLLDALTTGDQLVLELDTPVTPLALRVPDAASFAVLMPVRL